MFGHDILKQTPRIALPETPLLERAERIKDQALSRCSFCGKTAREVEKLVEAATGARICNECVSLCIPLMGRCCMPR